MRSALDVHSIAVLKRLARGRNLVVAVEVEISLMDATSSSATAIQQSMLPTRMVLRGGVRSGTAHARGSGLTKEQVDGLLRFCRAGPHHLLGLPEVPALVRDDRSAGVLRAGAAADRTADHLMRSAARWR
jgi:hypothetical protein